jgi:hypothetical protein
MNVRFILILAIAAAIALFSTSCKRGDPAAVAAVDSLLRKTDSLIAEVNALDMSPVPQDGFHLQRAAGLA